MNELTKAIVHIAILAFLVADIIRDVKKMRK